MHPCRAPHRTGSLHDRLTAPTYNKFKCRIYVKAQIMLSSVDHTHIKTGFVSQSHFVVDTTLFALGDLGDHSFKERGYSYLQIDAHDGSN